MVATVLCLVAESCLTLCNPMDCSPPGSSIHGILSRQEYWSGLPCPSPGDLPNPRTEPMSLMSPTLAGRFFTSWATWEVRGKFRSVQVNRLVVSNSLQHPWTATHQASRSITKSWSILKLMSIQSVIPSNHLILCHPPAFNLFQHQGLF